MSIDTTNKYLVGCRPKDGISILAPPDPLRPLTKDEALTFAAWIVCMVGDDERWAEVLEAVEST